MLARSSLRFSGHGILDVPRPSPLELVSSLDGAGGNLSHGTQTPEDAKILCPVATWPLLDIAVLRDLSDGNPSNGGRRQGTFTELSPEFCFDSVTLLHPALCLIFPLCQSTPATLLLLPPFSRAEAPCQEPVGVDVLCPEKIAVSLLNRLVYFTS